MKEIKRWDYDLDAKVPCVILEYAKGKKRKLTAGSRPRNKIEQKVVKALRDYQEDLIHYGPGRGFSWVKMETFFRLCDLLDVNKLSH